MKTTAEEIPDTEPLLRIYAEMVQAAADKRRVVRSRLLVVDAADEHEETEERVE